MHVHGRLNGTGVGRVSVACLARVAALSRPVTSCPLSIARFSHCFAVLSVDAHCLEQDLPILPRKGALPFRPRTAPTMNTRVW